MAIKHLDGLRIQGLSYTAGSNGSHEISTTNGSVATAGTKSSRAQEFGFRVNAGHVLVGKKPTSISMEMFRASSLTTGVIKLAWRRASDTDGTGTALEDSDTVNNSTLSVGDYSGGNYNWGTVTFNFDGTNTIEAGDYFLTNVTVASGNDIKNKFKNANTEANIEMVEYPFQVQSGYEPVATINYTISAVGDPKPINVQSGSRYEEVDTRKIFRRKIGALDNTTGLRFQYNFDEASGDVINYGSVASADLTVSNLDRDQSTPSGLGNGMNSGYGSGEYAVNTSRVNDYKFMHDGSKWSVTFWAYITQVPHSSSPTETACIGNIWTDDNGIGFTIRWAYGSSTTSCRIQTFIADGNSGMPLNDQTGDGFMPELNAWHFYCVTYDPTLGSNNLTVTRDAVASGTSAQGFHQGNEDNDTYSSSNPTRRCTYFSRWTDSAYDITMGGRLAQVTIWEDRILTQAEKVALYSSGNGISAVSSSWKAKGTV